MSKKLSVKVKVKVPMAKMLGGKKEQGGEGHASGGFLALMAKHKAKKKNPGSEESPAHEARESAAEERAEHKK